MTIIALLLTLVLLFSFKDEVILGNPLTILWIAVPLFLQTVLIFGVAIAAAVMLFGLSSGAALATVVGVLIEVPVMLMLVGVCKRTTHWFGSEA